NKTVFGKCANENWHGHNYELHVTVKGEINEETGYVMNAKHLGDIMKRRIVDVADHRNLNLEVPFMDGKLTSAENFAIAIWNELQAEIEAEGAFLHAIKLIETPRIYVEYFGPNA
ncbi:MAG: 6-pyruvoyl trahydropterin synthase family protein, partial [Chitinophagaceae bacterium]